MSRPVSWELVNAEQQSTASSTSIMTPSSSSNGDVSAQPSGIIDFAYVRQDAQAGWPCSTILAHPAQLQETTTAELNSMARYIQRGQTAQDIDDALSLQEPKREEQRTSAEPVRRWSSWRPRRRASNCINKAHEEASLRSRGLDPDEMTPSERLAHGMFGSSRRWNAREWEYNSVLEEVERLKKAAGAAHEEKRRMMKKKRKQISSSHLAGESWTPPGSPDFRGPRLPKERLQTELRKREMSKSESKEDEIDTFFDLEAEDGESDFFMPRPIGRSLRSLILDNASPTGNAPPSIRPKRRREVREDLESPGCMDELTSDEEFDSEGGLHRFISRIKSPSATGLSPPTLVYDNSDDDVPSDLHSPSTSGASPRVVQLPYRPPLEVGQPKVQQSKLKVHACGGHDSDAESLLD